MTLVTHRLARVFIAVVLAVVMGISHAGIAGAQTTGSLTVLRMNPDGTGAPIVGVPITINRVLDLAPTSQDELAALAKQEPDLLKGEPADRFGPSTTAFTNGRGEALFRGLERGVYLVRENPSRIGNVAYLTASAFLVSIPTVAGGLEDMDVVVQTKVQPVDITLHADKTVVRPGDDVLLWSDAGVPEVDVAGMLHQYSVVHALDRLLTFRRLASVRITGGGEDLVLVEGTDYTVTVRPAAAGGSFDEGTTLVGVTLTPEGLAKLAARRAGNPGVRVVTEIETTVKDSAKAGNKLSNRAFLLPDGWEERWDDLSGEDIESKVVELVVIDDVPPEPSSIPWWLFLPWLVWGIGEGSSSNGSSTGGQVPGEGSAESAGPGQSEAGTDSGQAAGRGPGSTVREYLASTGASVLWLIALALAAVILGLFLIVRERRREDEERVES